MHRLHTVSLIMFTHGHCCYFFFLQNVHSCVIGYCISLASSVLSLFLSYDLQKLLIFYSASTLAFLDLSLP